MLTSYQCIAGTSPAVLFGNEPQRTFVVTHFIISNSENANNNVSVFLVPKNGTPSISNAVIHQYKLTGNSYVEGTGGFVVPPNYSVYVQSTDANAVVATISGELTAGS